MAYYFFIDDVMLPVPPPKMSISIKNKNKTVSLINEGEINIIKTPGLTEVSFEVLLPNQYYSFADYSTSLKDSVIDSLTRKFLGFSYSFKKAEYYLEKIEKLKTENKSFRLIITRMTPKFKMLFDTNLLVTLEDYSIREDAREGFDVMVALKFKQYRPYATKELEVTTDKNGKKTAKIKEVRPTDKEVPGVYKIRNEKSIWEACKMLSGGKLDWRSVANLNNMLNPVKIEKGDLLKLGKKVLKLGR